MQKNNEKEFSQEEITVHEYLENVTQRIQNIDKLIEGLPKGLTLDPRPPRAPTDPGGKNFEYIQRLKHEKELIKSKVGDDIQKITEKSTKNVQLSVLKKYLLWEDPHAFDKDRINVAEGKNAFDIAEKKLLKQIIMQWEAGKALREKEINTLEEKSLFTSIYQSSLHYELKEVNFEPFDPSEAKGNVSMDKDDPGDLKIE